MKHSYSRIYIVFFLFFLLYGAYLRFLHLSSPMLDAYYFRQTQTATVARNFYDQGINLFRSELDIFGIGEEKYLVLECPTYQAVVAITAKLFGYSEEIARYISIISGLLSGLFLYCIVYKINRSRQLGFLSFVFFLFFPINIFFQRAVIIESFVVMLHLFALLLWVIYLNKNNIFIFLLTTFISAIAILSKIIYGPFLLLGMIGWAILRDKRNIKNPFLWILTIFEIFVSYTWQFIANQLNILSGQTFFTSTNRDHILWNIGTLNERFSLNSWSLRLSDIISGVTKIGLVLTFIGLCIVLVKKNKYGYWLLLFFVLVIYYLIFFRIQSHSYYFMIMIPVISVLCSISIVEINTFFKRKKIGVYVSSILTIIISFFIYKGVANVQGYYSIHSDVQNKIRVINNELKNPGPIVMIFPKWDWNSVYTYYTRRKGTVINFSDLSSIYYYKVQGYKYVVFMDFSDLDISHELLVRNHLIEKGRDRYIVITEFE